MMIRTRSMAWMAAGTIGVAGFCGCTTGPVAPAVVSIPASAAAPPASAPPQPASTAGMVLLPGDTFPITLGSMVIRTAKVLPFWLDVTEVTADAYKACVQAGKCTTTDLRCGEHATFEVSGKGDHPINCVDWTQADQYCKAQSKRLPTRDEWEWAARGTRAGTTFPWGDEEPSLTQICWARYGSASTPAGTCAVGAFPAGNSPQGIEDLQGNVAEWTSSVDEGSTDRVIRGGSWADNVTEVVTAGSSSSAAPSRHDHRRGFRCARSGE